MKLHVCCLLKKLGLLATDMLTEDMSTGSRDNLKYLAKKREIRHSKVLYHTSHLSFLHGRSVFLDSTNIQFKSLFSCLLVLHHVCILLPCGARMLQSEKEHDFHKDLFPTLANKLFLFMGKVYNVREMVHSKKKNLSSYICVLPLRHLV